jgi:hypothetical protein
MGCSLKRNAPLTQFALDDAQPVIGPRFAPTRWQRDAEGSYLFYFI